MLPERSNLPVAGARPLIDDLIVIGDDEHVLEFVSGQESDKPVLRGRSVLELVDQPVRIGLADARGHRGHLVRKTAGIENHAVEIHEVALAQRVIIDGIDAGGPFAGLRIAEVPRGFLRADKAAAQLVDGPEPPYVVRRDRLPSRGGLFQGVAKHFRAVFILVVDSEIRFDAQRRTVLPEHVSAKAVERADDGAVCEARHHRLNATPHLVANLGGEGQGRDAEVPVRCAVEDAGEAGCENHRLPGARTGQDQSGTFAPFHSLPLCRA